MVHRYLKMALAISVGLLAGLWCLNNLLNLEMAHGAVSYALTQQNQAGYSVRIVPPIDSPVLAALGLAIILIAEGAAGALSLLGAWRMWLARRLDTALFAAGSQIAALGAGIAVLTWFLGFQVIGGAAINMGQAEGLGEALEGSFRFGAYSFLTLIYLGLPEREGGGAVAGHRD